MTLVRATLEIASLVAVVSSLTGCNDGAAPVHIQPVTFALHGSVTGISVSWGEGPTDIVVGQQVAIRVTFLPNYVSAHYVAEPDTDFVVYGLPRDEENAVVIQIGDRTWTASLWQLALHNEAAMGDRLAVYGTYKLAEYVGTITFDFVDSVPPFDLLGSLALPSEQAEVGVHTQGGGHGLMDEIGWRVLFSTDEMGE
jgi:hypothetical protein